MKKLYKLLRNILKYEILNLAFIQAFIIKLCFMMFFVLWVSNIGYGQCIPPDATTNSPLDIHLCEGDALTIQIQITGTVGQIIWKKNGVIISGHTSNTFEISHLLPSDNGSYTAEVTSTCGSDIISPINVTVSPLPVFTLQPVNQTACVGTNVTFTALASNAISYQWYKDDVPLSDGGNISGSTSANLTITNLCASCDPGTYFVKAYSSADCFVSSADVELVVNKNLDQITVSSSSNHCEGENITLEVETSGTVYAYKWYKDNNLLTNQNSNILNLYNLTVQQAGEYTVELDGACEVKTENIYLHIDPRPQITLQPQNLISCLGISGSFTTNGNNVGEYRWYKNDVPYNFNNSTLNIDKLSNSDYANYYVRLYGYGACYNTYVQSQTVQIDLNTKPNSTNIIKNVSCFDAKDGSISVTPNGGFGAPYQIIWQNPNGLSGGSASNLDVGNYSFTVIDSKGCSNAESVSIIQPDKLTLGLLSKTLNYCESSGKAQIITAAKGGTLPYSISWGDDFNEKTFTRKNLKAGVYNETIIDANLCTSTLSTTIADSSSKMTASLTYTPPTCYGKANAQLKVLATGGRNGYTYAWTGLNGYTSGAEILNFVANNESVYVTVKDSLGCEVKLAPIIATTPLAEGLSINKFQEVCPSKPFNLDGTIADGSQYLWLTPLGKKLNTPIIAGDTLGTYQIIVTKINGCVAKDSVKIVANSNVKPFFASPTDAPVNKEVVFVDISAPNPTAIKWIYPTSASLISDQTYTLRLKFINTGRYTVSSLVTINDCAYPVRKIINILNSVDDGNFSPPVGFENNNFSIVSNPVASNLVTIKLYEDHPTDFTISVYSLKGTNQIFSKKFTNVLTDSVNLELPLDAINESSYILSFENGFSKVSKRLVIAK